MRITRPFNSAHRSDRSAGVEIKLSEVMGALSFALDLVEGQPEGHAIRSCLIGMRIGADLGLSHEQLSSLFYALLMKDLGCSSNSAKMCVLFAADDLETKSAIKTHDWTNVFQSLKFAASHVAPRGTMLMRAKRLCGIAVAGQRTAKQLVKIRCERGAAIARQFELSDETALAIHALDEHWDGGGHPEGTIGEETPLLARILGIAQTAEVFLSKHGLNAMRDMLRDRTGTWFDPSLADILLNVGDSDPLWQHLSGNPRDFLPLYEPEDQVLFADDERLDRIASGFAQIIDAKSPWTFRHSLGVSEISVGIANTLGMPAKLVRDIRRAALMHDIGKLGVSNLILDKPGKLTPEEMTEMRRHPDYTFRILQRVAGFSRLAEMAASHHERLDGHGYHRGIEGKQLSPAVRILAVADMYEALASKRPYREEMSDAEVMSILDKNAGAGICPMTLAALKTYISRNGYKPVPLAA